jgi:hypothetical protein
VRLIFQGAEYARQDGLNETCVPTSLPPTEEPNLPLLDKFIYLPTVNPVKDFNQAKLRVCADAHIRSKQKRGGDCQFPSRFCLHLEPVWSQLSTSHADRGVAQVSSAVMYNSPRTKPRAA